MKNLGAFLREVKVELTKVVWPTKEDFWGSVVVVLITMTVFAVFLGLVNYIFYTGAQKVFEWFVIGR